MNATTLREMLNKSVDLPIDGGRIDSELIGPLLDVLEAAEKAQYGVVERCGRGEETGFYRVGESDMKAMRAAIAALYRRAGEVMDG